MLLLAQFVVAPTLLLNVLGSLKQLFNSSAGFAAWAAVPDSPKTSSAAASNFNLMLISIYSIGYADRVIVRV